MPKLGVCGAGLALLTNGLSALEAISPELLERIRNAGIINGSVYSHSAAGMAMPRHTAVDIVPDNLLAFLFALRQLASSCRR